MSINKIIFNILSIGYFISQSLYNTPSDLITHLVNVFISMSTIILFLVLINVVNNKFIPFIYGALLYIFINHIFLTYLDIEVIMLSIPYWLTFLGASIVSISIDVFHDKEIFDK